MSHNSCGNESSSCQSTSLSRGIEPVIPTYGADTEVTSLMRDYFSLGTFPSIEVSKSLSQLRLETAREQAFKTMETGPEVDGKETEAR